MHDVNAMAGDSRMCYGVCDSIFGDFGKVSFGRGMRTILLPSIYFCILPICVEFDWIQLNCTATRFDFTRCLPKDFGPFQRMCSRISTFHLPHATWHMEFRRKNSRSDKVFRLYERPGSSDPVSDFGSSITPPRPPLPALPPD